MASLLIVDDVREICEELAWALLPDGHTITYASNAEEGIYRGVTERPQVLIADWLLREELNGLDVVEAIQTALPSVRPIVITGFATHDLRTDANAFGITDLLEKPFSPEQLRSVVNTTLLAARQERPIVQIAVFERGLTGEVLYANPQTATVFGCKKGGENLFHNLVKDERLLGAALSEWSELPPLPNTTCPLLIRGRVLDERHSHLYVALPEKSEPLTRLAHRILGIPERTSPFPLFSGNALVIDPQEEQRRVATKLIRHFRQNCHSAESVEEAVRVFAHDPDIRVVLINGALPDGNPLTLAKHLHALRPEIRVIGSGEGKFRVLFQQVGIQQFLQEPWTVNDFVLLFPPMGAALTSVSSLPATKQHKWWWDQLEARDDRSLLPR